MTQVHGSNGLMTKFVMDILRPEYNQNKLTKKILDDLMFNNFRKYKNFIILILMMKQKNSKTFNKLY